MDQKKNNILTRFISDVNRVIILPKLSLILTIIFIIWVVIVTSGIYLLELEHTWAGLTLSAWLYLISIILGVLIILNLIVFFYPTFGKTAKKTPEIIEGKQVYEYTYPEGTEGGLFSKTYILIDENTVIRVRNLLVSADELWNKKEEKE